MMENWSASLDFPGLQQRYGTPLYLFNPEQLIQNIADFLTLVRDPANIAFPVKACPSMPVLQIISQYGLSIDCAAPTEISMALEAGVPYRRLFYNSPDLNEEAARAILNGGGTLVLNDVEQLTSFVHAKSESMGKLFLRWNPDVAADGNGSENTMTAHGRSSSQFGSAREAILALPPSELRRIDGLHTHIGSRVKTLKLFTDALNNLHELVEAIFRLSGHRISVLNIGGGLKLAMNDDDVCPTINEYAFSIKRIFRKNIRYIIEPGNALVGNTMGLLSSVKAIKNRPNGSRFAIIDVGSNQLIKYTLSGISPTVLTKEGKTIPAKGEDAVAGPLCFAGDVILAETCLKDLQPGDPLFIQHCGAYCMALSHQFNGRFRPAVLTIDKDKGEYVSQMAENMWLTSPASVGLMWQTDRSESFLQNTISVPEIFSVPAKVLSTGRTGKRSYCFDLSFRQSPGILEKLSVIFHLTKAIMVELHPEAKLSEPDGLVLLPHLEDNFRANETITISISVSAPTPQGIRISFGHERDLIGFYGIRLLSDS